MTISELLEQLNSNFASLTSGDKVIGGLVVTLLCMVIVFAVLVVLMFIVKAMRVFSGGSAKKEQASAPAPEPVKPAPVVQTEISDDDEVIAVMTAALAAAGGSRSNLVVRSIVRVPDSGTQWSKTGPNPGVGGTNGWN